MPNNRPIIPMTRKLIFLLSLLILVTSQIGWARQQGAPARLQGVVTDSTTGLPLQGAHVFIAGSMTGSITDSEGRYTLERVPMGAHRLYVSMLGFRPDFRDIMLRSSRVYTFDFELAEDIIQAGEIVVEAERDDKWLDRLRRFEEMFIGETPNALETEIMNPEVLDFEVSRGAFTAVASEPLIIENRALGYRIQYFLRDFQSTPNRVQYDGEPLYEELEPESPGQAAEWEKKRRDSFMGSFRHFALALIAGRTEPQGFKTYTRPSVQRVNGGTFGGGAMQGQQRFPLDPSNIIRPGENPNEYILDIDGVVEIVYMGEEEDEAFLKWRTGAGRARPGFQTSWITMDNGPTVMDYKGDTLDPYGVTFMGYLAWQRVADDVPREYRPGR